MQLRDRNARQRRSSGTAGALTLLLVAAFSGCRQAPALVDSSELHSEGSATPNDEEYSVVLAGHVYSLYVETKSERRYPAIGFTTPLQAFAREVEEIDPRRVFLLGDNVRYGNEEEWTFLEESFASAQRKFTTLHRSAAPKLDRRSGVQ